MKKKMQSIIGMVKGFCLCLILLSFCLNAYLYSRIQAIGGIEVLYTDDMRVNMTALVGSMESVYAEIEK